MQDNTEVIEYIPNPARRARLLRLAQMEHEAYGFWRGCLFYCGWISVILAVVGVPMFGLWWRVEHMLWAVYIPAMLLGLFVLVAAGLLEAGGLFTCWTLMTAETAALEPDALRFSVRRGNSLWPRQTGEPWVWVQPYANIHRMEYDRSAKRLRVYGYFRSEDCVLPSERHVKLPRGMLPPGPRENRTANECYVDIPLYTEKSESFLQELQQRCNVFIHPAIRGDDYADLRDLPGLKPALPVFRPMLLFLVTMSLLTLALAHNIRRYHAENPWQPYPLTEEAVLTRIHQAGQSAILDGCRITLQSAVPGTDGGMSLTYLWENLNDTADIYLHLDQANSNVTVRAETGLGLEDCSYIPLREQLVRIGPGGKYTLKVLYSIPNGAKRLVVEFNSDRWAAKTWFWEPEYLGRTRVIGGQEYFHNRVIWHLTVEQ